MQFHKTTDIFLHFRMSKWTQEKADELRKEPRRQSAQMRGRVPPSQRRPISNNHRPAIDLRMELIHSESNFNLVNIDLRGHFHDDIYMFGNLPLYSTLYAELAHKEQIKDGC